MEVLISQSNGIKLVKDCKEKFEVHVLSETGSFEFSYNNYGKVSTEEELKMFSSFVLALHLFAQDMGRKDLKAVELGQEKIYLTRDKMTKNIFIFKCNGQLKEKKIIQNLKKIKNLYIERFTGSLTLSAINKEDIRELFVNDLKKLLNNKSVTANFLSLL